MPTAELEGPVVCVEAPVGQLVRPVCGCPFEEFEHRGITVCVHADPAVPISAYVYDFDTGIDLKATTMAAAHVETCEWIDSLLGDI